MRVDVCMLGYVYITYICGSVHVVAHVCMWCIVGCACYSMCVYIVCVGDVHSTAHVCLWCMCVCVCRSTYVYMMYVGGCACSSICMSMMYVCGCVHAMTHLKLEDRVVELVVTLYLYVAAGDWTQIIRVGWQALYWLNRITGPPSFSLWGHTLFQVLGLIRSP